MDASVSRTSNKIASGDYKPRPELFGIQILRVVAAIAVVIYHTIEISMGFKFDVGVPKFLITAGAAGVDIFFVISGFIMIYVAFRGDGSAIGPGEFLYRRFSRIYPFYWLCCLGMVFLGALGFMSSMDMSPLNVLRSMLLWPEGQKLLGVSWTLSYEIYFYLIFAVALTFRNLPITIAFTGATICAATVIAAFLPANELVDFLRNPVALEFVFGMGVAWAVTRFSDKLKLSPYWSLLGFAAIIIAPIFVFHTKTDGLPGFYRPIFWGLPAAGILLVFARVARPSGLPGRVLAMLADASYAIYLTHPFVMVAYAKLLKSSALGRMHQELPIAIVVVISIAGGILAHLIVERRLIAWARALHLWHGRKRVPA